jgi:hypothetical protein
MEQIMRIEVKFTDQSILPEIFETDEPRISRVDVTYQGGFVIVSWWENQDTSKPWSITQCSKAFPAHRVLMVVLNDRCVYTVASSTPVADTMCP